MQLDLFLKRRFHDPRMPDSWLTADLQKRAEMFAIISFCRLSLSVSVRPPLLNSLLPPPLAPARVIAGSLLNSHNALL